MTRLIVVELAKEINPENVSEPRGVVMAEVCWQKFKLRAAKG